MPIAAKTENTLTMGLLLLSPALLISTPALMAPATPKSTNGRTSQLLAPGIRKARKIIAKNTSHTIWRFLICGGGACSGGGGTVGAAGDGDGRLF